MALTDLIPFRKNRRREDPVKHHVDPFQRLQEEMNRVFESWLPSGRNLMGWPAADQDFAPDIDVKESKKEIQVTAELPGVDEADIDLRLDGDTLTIRGEKREETTEKDGAWTRSECRYGSFVRSVPLGAEVDADRVKATFKKGVLKVRLPKVEQTAANTRRIEVKAG